MNYVTSIMEAVRDSENELHTLVELSDKTELGQCIRLLSVYLSIYKKNYGELSGKQLENIINREEMDPETAVLFNRGIREAIDILAMVLQSQGTSCPDSDVALN